MEKVKLALPFLSSEPEANTTLPSSKVTVPVGVEPPLVALTVKVTGLLIVLGLELEATVSVVGSVSSTSGAVVMTEGEFDAFDVMLTEP